MKGFEPEVFTVDEAAEFARVSPAKIEQWMAKGLKHIRTGSDPGKPGPANAIVLREHLMAWMRSLADSPAKALLAKKPGRPRKVAGEAPRGPKYVS